jgi:hypothetical protein
MKKPRSKMAAAAVRLRLQQSPKMPSETDEVNLFSRPSELS